MWAAKALLFLAFMLLEAQRRASPCLLHALVMRQHVLTFNPSAFDQERPSIGQALVVPVNRRHGRGKPTACDTESA